MGTSAEGHLSQGTRRAALGVLEGQSQSSLRLRRIALGLEESRSEQLATNHSGPDTCLIVRTTGMHSVQATYPIASMQRIRNFSPPLSIPPAVRYLLTWTALRLKLRTGCKGLHPSSRSDQQVLSSDHSDVRCSGITGPTKK